MGGFHFSSLIVVLVIGLAIAGPKALQSMSRHVGRHVSQTRAMKEQAMAELPLEEIDGLSQSISKMPLSPQQALLKLLTAEPEKKKPETKKEGSPPLEKKP